MPSPSYNYIWYFKERGFTDGQTAPELAGANGSPSSLNPFSDDTEIGLEITPDIADYTYINVSKEFKWTTNDSREEVPRIILKESLQDQAAQIQRGLVFLKQGLDAIPFGDPLTTYQELYANEDTGFYYDLPNLNESYMSTGNNKFDVSGAGALGEVANQMSAMSSGASKDTKMGKLGSFIKGAQGVGQGLSALGKLAGGVRELFGGGAGYYTEQPKFYQHGQNARNYQVQFPLFNTVSYEDLLLNFQLVFMLIYQNLPNRASRQLILPPCMYEVTVPGVSYCPWAYMSSVEVEFLGTRRELNLEIPFESMESLQTCRVVVPDAYLVKLNIQELVGYTKNFMYSNINKKVSTAQIDVEED